MKKEKAVFFILRFGLAFSFIYASLAAYFDPFSWIGFFPEITKGIVPDKMLLNSWGVVQILIGLWLLSGKRLFYASLIASTSLFFVVVFNYRIMDIVFRDVTIFAIAIALALNYAPKKE